MASTRAPSLVSRAVHIKIQPAPRSIHDSRQILRILKDFGEVVSFRSLRHDPVDPAPNTIVAIYQTPSSAQNLISASPLHFSLEPPVSGSLVTGPSSFGITSLFSSPSSSSYSSTSSSYSSTTTARAEGGRGLEKESGSPHRLFDDASDGPPKGSEEFELTAAPSTMDHTSHTQRQSYYWGFRGNRRSVAEANLVNLVPTPGLSSVAVAPTELPNRIVRRNLESVASMKSLRELWEAGIAAQPGR